MSVFGNKGKFSERLKNILRFKRKKQNVDKQNEILDTNKIYTDYLKVMAAIPGFVAGSLTSTEPISNKQPEKTHINIEDESSKQQISDEIISSQNRQSINLENSTQVTRNNEVLSSKKIDNLSIREENRKKINEIDLTALRKTQQLYDVNKAVEVTEKDIKAQRKLSSLASSNKQNECQKLEKSIISIIKKKLIKTVNELEILQSELYILSEVNGESKELKECQSELDHVKSILCKIDKLKEQYDFLKDNYDFEYLLELGDNNLVDKIIELKDTFGRNELKAVSVDYKLLDVYKYLYLKIDDLEEKTVKFEEYKSNEVLKLKERDIDFDKLKNDVYNVESINENYNSFVQSQNNLLREIDENVSKISSYEQVDYHLKGFNALFRNCFKYFGLLMVSPLKGVIPSIATETLLTGNIIKNLYKNLEWEETRKTVYEAMDYSSMISSAIGDLESTNRIVDSTLDDIVHLKMKYNEKFRKYSGDFLEYRDIMRKIGDMENKILGNKIKIEMMRQRALEQQRLNDKKLVLVKELNRKENHN